MVAWKVGGGETLLKEHMETLVCDENVYLDYNDSFVGIFTCQK